MRSKQGFSCSHLFFQTIAPLKTEVWKHVWNQLCYWNSCACAAVLPTQTRLSLTVPVWAPPSLHIAEPFLIRFPGNSAGFLWHFNWHTSCCRPKHTWTHTYAHMATYIRFLFSGRFVIISQFPKQIHKIIFLLPPMYLIILENCTTFILYTFSQIHKRTVCVDMIYSMTYKL